MSTWIIAKPRLRFADAIDSFFMHMSAFPQLNSFVMKPTYMQSRAGLNHDELFAAFLKNDNAGLKAVENFFSIYHGLTAHSVFSPVVTNRLLTPVFPKDVNPKENFRRRVRNRLNSMFEGLGRHLEGKINCLILAPDPESFSEAAQLGLMLEDGYTESKAVAITDKLIEIMQFSEYKIRESDQFARIEKHIVPPGASFGYLYTLLLQLGINLPAVPPPALVSPNQTMDFYMLEAIIPTEVRRCLLAARPTERSSVNRSFYQIIEALLYTRAFLNSAEAPSVATSGDLELDLSKFTLADALSLDEAARCSFLYRTVESS